MTFTPTRTVFNIVYLLDNKYPLNRKDAIRAQIALFYNNAFWATDDNLARNIQTAVENELGQPILLLSWGVED